ncbi:MAG: serine/threonine-protein kinase [Acidobacteriota bacterium]
MSTAANPSTLFPSAPTVSFPYRVEREAGAGAMGVVYRAVDTTLERPVAIKLLQPRNQESAIDDDMRRRFLQEARAAAALSHPGVTMVHQIGELEGVPYIVMEWLEGTTLELLMQREKSLTLERAAQLVGELLEVLAVAHQGGVVHRDLKPSNLVLLQTGRLKVTDFGIALLQGGRNLVETVAGSVLATPQFASPEQLEGRSVDGRADLFAVGELFYHLLTGAMPFEGRNLIELITSVLHKDPVPLRTRWPGVPADVEAWCLKALNKRPQDRFDSALEMADALKQAVRGPMESRSLAETKWTTRLMTAPASIVMSTAPSANVTVLELMRSWPSRDMGQMDRESFFSKLLETPLHAEAFSGLARFGDVGLLVSAGVVVAALGPNEVQASGDVELPERAQTEVHPMPPSGWSAQMICLLASAFHASAPKHQGLDTSVVNLPAFAGKLLEEGFSGLMILREGERWASVLLDDGRSDLALVSDGWDENPRGTEWNQWLGGVAASADVLERQVLPPAVWFRYAFKASNLEVRAAIPDKAQEGSGSMSLTRVLPMVGREAVWTFSPRLEDIRRDSLSLADAPAGRVASWLFGELPKVMVERRLGAGWKYLGDWLLEVRQLKIHAKLQDAGEFDLVTGDANGKVLHLAHRIPDLDVECFQKFVDRVVAAKEARLKNGDIGGVILVARSLDSAVLEAYRSLIKKGWGNRLFGFDKSMGYEGFVRMSARRGFHFLLVEETPDGFVPIFEV